MHLRLGTLTSIKFQEDQLNCHCQQILVTLQELYGLNMGRLHKLDLSCATTIKNTVEHMKKMYFGIIKLTPHIAGRIDLV